jgi:transcriptional regulator with XRE-family HTH domain
METAEFSQELIKLGKRLRQLRKHRKIKLLDLEVLSGINDSDISRYERGKENIEFLTIFKLAKALEVEISTIAEYDGPLPDNATFKGLGKVNAIYSKRKKKSLK